MREALIEAEEERTSNKTTGRYRFNKRLLLESTSLVHSPIDITLQSLPFSCDDELDLCVKSKNSLQIRKLKQIQRYPKSQDIFTMSCKVNKGEAIWIPSFWWHEVTSIPGSRNPEVPLNVAVNLWFDPLFRKEFPCKSCTQRRINQVYTSLIRQLVRNHVIK